MAIAKVILTQPEQNQASQIEILSNHFGFKPNSPDTLIIAAESTISIKQTRLVAHYLASTPFESNQKSVVIIDSQNLSLPAQNSFLKLLEEPPSYARFYLTTPNPYLLKPTILSRCQVQTFPSSNVSTPNLSLNIVALSNQPTSTRLHYLLDSSQTSKEELLSIISQLRTQLKSQPNQPSLFNLTLALYCYQLLQQNTNPKLVFHYLFLNLKSQPHSSQEAFSPAS